MIKFFELISTGFYIGRLKNGATIAPLLFSFLVLFENKLLIFFILLLLSVISSYLMVKKTKRNDPQEVVIDEIISLVFIFLFVEVSLKSFIIAFILFRLFDFLKPFPSNLFESIPYLGIVLDDMIASIYVVIFLKWIFGL